MVDVVIDTDVASLIQKARAPEWVHRHVVGARVWLTFVAVGELWKWAEVRNWGEANRSRLGAWIAARPVLPYDPEIARTWARMSGWGAAARTTQAPERYLDRRLLRPTRGAARDAEHQGLRTLRRARRARPSRRGELIRSPLATV